MMKILIELGINMYRYRITKYNPKFRDEKGKYIKQEWTSVWDIENKNSNVILKFDEYINYESKYVDCVYKILNYYNIKFLTINNLEKPIGITRKISSQQLQELIGKDLECELYKNITDNQKIIYSNIEDIIKMIFREELWCNLNDTSLGLTFQFGYDYYMYVNSNFNIPFENIPVDNGIFIENISQI